MMNSSVTTSPKQAGNAGFLAALVMITAQLLWRLMTDNSVVQAFPEFVVAAIARLMPLSVFGAATENYGSLAKKTLFFCVLLGIAGAGFFGGRLAGRLTARTGTSFAGRTLAGLLVASAFWLATNLLIMPIAHLGLFARDSSYTSQIHLQLASTFCLYAVVWALGTAPQFEEESMPTPTGEYSRRTILQGAFDAATLAAVAAAGLTGWRIITPKGGTVSVQSAESSVDDIVATQRASQGYPLTPTPARPATPRDSASLTNDVMLQDDPFALFGQLEEQERITAVLTPIPDFYNVSKNLFDPEVGAEGWTLKITGMVDNEIELTYDQIVERSTATNITTLCCISNDLNGSLISTAQWTGIPLAELLTEAGIQAGAVDLKFHAADDYEDSVAIDVGMSPDNMIVTGMNGETLPSKHGFPARLIIPNIYGMKNVKWLDRIEVVGEDFKGYWQTRGWSDTAVVEIWGRIDFPQKGDVDSDGLVAAGVASAGARDVGRVEVSLDDGASWEDAFLEPSLNPPFTWVRWALPIEGDSGEYKMRIRVTDGEGSLMDETKRFPLPGGATGWPERTFEIRE
ncbi:MAG: molybdopterin-dependent oxidoreductase [Thermomicrobiales bacterium]|nr:molybdopterin-dependent oxidoreductase [Thermomicrobiales bacterium]